jgi:hypothetical protein
MLLCVAARAAQHSTELFFVHIIEHTGAARREEGKNNNKAKLVLLLLLVVIIAAAFGFPLPPPAPHPYDILILCVYMWCTFFKFSCVVAKH